MICQGQSMTPCASRWSTHNMQVRQCSLKAAIMFFKGGLDGGALQDARAAHTFSAACCCKDFNILPGQYPSVICVCLVLRKNNGAG